MVAFSATKACTVRIAPMFSEAKALAAASVSCAARERARTMRPENTSGNTITGIATSTSPDSFGLVTIIMPMAPTNMKMLRRAIEADEPKAARICVVSAVRRETSSPVFAVS